MRKRQYSEKMKNPSCKQTSKLLDYTCVLKCMHTRVQLHICDFAVVVTLDLAKEVQDLSLL